MNKLDEILLYFLSNIFTTKLNALGISNLPTAITTIKSARKQVSKKGWLLYGAGVFHTLVVYSGVTNRWPRLIKVNAVANIANGVKESINTRKQKQADEEERKKKQDEAASTPTKCSAVTSMFKSLVSTKKQDPKKEEQEPTKTRYALDKAKALLAGQRDSAVDDLLWGVFQVSLVFFDVGQWQAIGHAWMVFLLHSLEKTAFNDKLKGKQKIKKFAWLTVVAYSSGKLVFYK